jgi:recombination protein RecA
MSALATSQLLEQIEGVSPATRLGGAAQAARAWSLEALAGRFVEITHRGAGACLTWAADLVWQAQRAGEPVAWVRATPSVLFGPDLDAWGIDLAALPVVQAPDAQAAARAADKLLRSGAFGLLLLDLGGSAELPAPLLGRLVKLAQQHHSAVVALTSSDAASQALGSLVSLRVESTRRREPYGGGVRVSLEAHKDKRHGPGWRLSCVRAPVAGMG